MSDAQISRRTMLGGMLGGLATAALWPPSLFAGTDRKLITEPIPSTGEHIPVVGMGTWQTFNVGNDRRLRDARTQVLKAFFELGGSVIDSSPMYGSSHEVVGYGLDKLDKHDRVFSADKVWTRSDSEARPQMEETKDEWGIEFFDLMQVHNLLAWEKRLPMLLDLKASGHIRYVGVTTSHGRRHDALEKIMRTRDIDFVQLSYSLANREAEQRLLPLAKERGIAVIANRPFRQGHLVDRFQDNNHPLPEWASEFGCNNWPQFLLKFIVSHPAVTCAIPATTKVEHMRENMLAARGALPGDKMRERMIGYVESL